PVLREYLVHPRLKLSLKEADVFEWIVTPRRDRFSLRIRRTRRSDNVDQSIRHAKVVYELVPEALSLRDSGPETRTVDQFNRGEPFTINTSRITSLIFPATLLADALLP